MRYCLVEVHGFSQISYAHRYSASNFSNIVQCPANVLEIGVCTMNPLYTETLSGEKNVYKENDIYVIFPGDKFQAQTFSSTLHTHTTIGITLSMVPQVVFIEKLSDFDFGSLKENQILFPDKIAFDVESKEIISKIHMIVSNHMTNNSNYFDDCKNIMELFSFIKNYVEKISQKKEGSARPANYLYCRKAEKYIENHITEKISVSDVANSLGISKNYLTNIFSEARGIPLLEYINRMKLNYMIELMLRLDYNLSKASAAVSIMDENYASRLFKKYYGITWSKYKQMKRDDIV